MPAATSTASDGRNGAKSKYSSADVPAGVRSMKRTAPTMRSSTSAMTFTVVGYASKRSARRPSG
jgi:hypothetical protein